MLNQTVMSMIEQTEAAQNRARAAQELSDTYLKGYWQRAYLNATPRPYLPLSQKHISPIERTTGTHVYHEVVEGGY